MQVLNLSEMTLSHVTMGHVINIASNDVHRFDMKSVSNNVPLHYMFYLLVCHIFSILPGVSFSLGCCCISIIS